MDKTCLTCKNYIPCLIDENSDFHIHDFCKVWHAEIPSVYQHEKYCNEKCPHQDEKDFLCKNCQNSADDIEAEVAVCWCWEEK